MNTHNAVVGEPDVQGSMINLTSKFKYSILLIYNILQTSNAHHTKKEKGYLYSKGKLAVNLRIVLQINMQLQNKKTKT